MIAYEIQLRYVIRDKIRSETNSVKDKIWEFFYRKNILGFCLGLNFVSDFQCAFLELPRTNRCLSSLSGIYIPQEKITRHYFSVFRWLKETVPHYYSKTCEFLGPYLRLFWEKLYELGVYLAEVTKPLRDYLNEKIPLLLEWVCIIVSKYYPFCCWIFYILNGWQF